MEKVFTGMIIQKKHTRSVTVDPNQGIGGRCHKLVDHLLQGPAVRRDVYEDPIRQDTVEVDEMADRPVYQR
jgi:hypothetical protein